MKRSSPQSRIPNCPKKTCVFPNTCEWNKRCMQMGLNLSVDAKKKTMEKAKAKGNPKQIKPMAS